MSKEQPEALRLAELIDYHAPIDFDGHLAQAAAELRRLHAENEALRAQIGQGVPDGLLESQIEPRPLLYPLSDYHRAMADGPLHYTWIDKPHRLVYDLIAAVRYYASAHPAPQQKPNHWVVPEYGFLFPSEEAAKRYLSNTGSDAQPIACYTYPAPQQIGQGVPDGVLDALDNFEKKERSPFQAYLAAGLVNELRTALLASAPPAPRQQQPLTDEQQIAEAMRKHGFALVKTATGYDVMKLGPCIANNTGVARPTVQRLPADDTEGGAV